MTEHLHSLLRLHVHLNRVTRKWEVDSGPGTQILASSPDWLEAISAADERSRRWRGHFTAFGW